MATVKRKPNYFDKTKTDIEGTNKTVLEIFEENDVEFEYNTQKQTGECSSVNVATILSYTKDKNWVSLQLYLKVEESSVVLTLIK